MRNVHRFTLSALLLGAVVIAGCSSGPGPMTGNGDARSSAGAAAGQSGDDCPKVGTNWSMTKIDRVSLEQYPDAAKKIYQDALDSSGATGGVPPWETPPSATYPEMRALVETTPAGGQQRYVDDMCLQGLKFQETATGQGRDSLNWMESFEKDHPNWASDDFSVSQSLVNGYAECISTRQFKQTFDQYGGEKLDIPTLSPEVDPVLMIRSINKNLCPQIDFASIYSGF